MNIRDKFLELPLIQGGMGVGVSLGNLAGHVAKCGAMGVISTADIGFREEDFWKKPDEANIRALKKEIQKAREISGGNGLVAINAMVATENYEALIQVAKELEIDCIISGAGLPMELPHLVESSSVAIAPIVSSAKAAHTICKLWDKRYAKAPDFVVLEGPEAGGHLGFHEAELENQTAPNLDNLLPSVLEALKPFCEKYKRKIPVFTAGGIFTADDVMKFIKMGADGVQVATRFIATVECDASEAYKKVFINSKKEDIEIVKSPVGMPGRAFRTPLIERVKANLSVKAEKCIRCLRPCNPLAAPYCITSALIQAVKGDYENGLYFCGSNAWRIQEMTNVSGLIDELMLKWRATV